MQLRPESARLLPQLNRLIKANASDGRQLYLNMLDIKWEYDPGGTPPGTAVLYGIFAFDASSQGQRVGFTVTGQEAVDVAAELDKGWALSIDAEWAAGV